MTFNNPMAERDATSGEITRAGYVPARRAGHRRLPVKAPAGSVGRSDRPGAAVPCEEAHVAVVLAAPEVSVDGDLDAACERAVGDAPGDPGEVRSVAPTSQVRATYGIGSLVCIWI